MKTHDENKGIVDLAKTSAESCDCGTIPSKVEIIDECVKDTEALFASGSHHCAESVIAVIRKHFSPDTPELVVSLVSGLGGGCGVGCICGALSAASIAFAMVLPDDKERVAQLTRSLHEWFRGIYGAPCCRALQNKHDEGCRVSPGAVAGMIAQLLLAPDNSNL